MPVQPVSATALHAAATQAQDAVTSLQWAYLARQDGLGDRTDAAFVARLDRAREHLSAAADTESVKWPYNRRAMINASIQTAVLLAGPFLAVLLIRLTNRPIAVAAAVCLVLVIADIGGWVANRVIDARISRSFPQEPTAPERSREHTYRTVLATIDLLDRTTASALDAIPGDHEKIEHLHQVREWLTEARRAVPDNHRGVTAV
ncbi:hypothetical protein EDC02_7635 [Micromonospora sp. Llam0]|nr:hypothetical protein EDC02_7635 [Micromonospora sp. Llam0]